RAHLNMADLREAKLYKANLSRADLNGANLLGADLGGANLPGADLRGANLEEVENLTQQQLNEAKTDEKTILPDYLLNK
ncbi:MAG: pentapeptide repeat-containing protein, partial [Candidatus Binatia bacterium]